MTLGDTMRLTASDSAPPATATVPPGRALEKPIDQVIADTKTRALDNGATEITGQEIIEEATAGAALRRLGILRGKNVF
jgi:hypothetical protein